MILYHFGEKDKKSVNNIGIFKIFDISRNYLSI